MKLLKRGGVFCFLSLFSLIAHSLEIDLYQGHAALAKLDAAYEASSEVLCEGHKLPILKTSSGPKVFLREAHHAKVRRYDCLIDKKVVFSVKVMKFNYPSERLKVDRKKIDLSKKDLDRYLREKEVLTKVFAEGEKVKAHFDSAFANPIDSIITGVFGTKRVFNKKKESVHLGVDFRAAVGTPIYATNNGKIAVSDEFFFNGGTVIIDHGAGIFSMYCHLSEQKVAMGQMVKKGELIGLAGKSGRSTGPHLHWGIKMYGEWIDGTSLVQAGL